MVMQCVSCEKIFENSSDECPYCKSGNIVVGYIDDDFIPILIKTKREDGEISTCVIEMPESFLERKQYDDTYDEMLSVKVEDKLYFEGLGYNIIKIEKLEM